MDSRELRARAAQACVDTFMGKPLKPGTADCVCLGRKSMHVQGVSASLMKGKRYRSMSGGLRVIKALGFESLIDAVDAVEGLTPIAPAMCWPGDIIAMPAEEGDPFGAALIVYLGNRKAIGFGKGKPAGIVRPDLSQAIKAWRVG